MKYFTARPLLALTVISLLTCILLSSGSLNSIDTLNRLQVTHALWTGEPQVPYPGDGFSVMGRGHQYYVTWGIGQSLAMLPGDILGTGIVRLLHIHQNADTVRTAVVSYTTFPIINTIAIIFVFFLLREFAFSEKQAWLGALGVLLCTSFLSYAQVHDEDSLEFMCLCGGYLGSLIWLRRGELRYLVFGITCLGLSLLMRLPGLADYFVVAAFTLILLIQKLARDGRLSRAAAGSIAKYALLSGICYLPFLVIDRFYQWLRFGSVLTTYTTLWGAQMRSLYPQLPASFPFDTPFRVGFLGQLFSPDRSTFLFNPLLLVVVALFARYWSSIEFRLKVFLAANSVLLLADIAFYSKWFEWGGSGSWGPRYAIVPSQALALLAIPLFLRVYPSIKSALEKIVYAGVFAVSSVVQLTSVLYDYNLEIYQEATFHLKYVVIWQRLVNVFALASGKFVAWGLTPHRSELEVNRVMTLAFMPWRTMRQFPHRVSIELQICWLLGLLVLVGFGCAFVLRSLRPEAAHGRRGISAGPLATSNVAASRSTD